jgi:hypothetical protein
VSSFVPLWRWLLVHSSSHRPPMPDSPSRGPSPINDETFPGVCSFTVKRKVFVNKSLLTYSNGDQRITRTFKQRLINLSTDTFVDLNSPGPVFLDYRADGRAAKPTSVHHSSVRPGQLLVTTGLVVWEFDSDGNFVSYTQRRDKPRTSPRCSLSPPSRSGCSRRCRCCGRPMQPG